MHFLILFIMCLISYPAYSVELSFQDNKSEYLASTPIKVVFKGAQGLDKKAWLGIFKEGDTNERKYISYQYLNGKPSGVLTLKAPSAAGRYEFRVVGNGRQTGRLLFSVKAVQGASVELSLDKRAYKPVEDMKVTVRTENTLAEKSWVGIFPVNGSSQRNKNYTTYQYTNGKKHNVFSFKAPEQPGSYELRFFDDSYGNEIKSLAFSVEGFSGTGLSIKTDKTSYAPQSDMVVQFVADKDFPQNAWIGIFSEKEPQTKKYMDYRYLDKKAKGTLSFKTPVTKGNYLLKMYSSYSGTVVATSRFRVSSSLDASYMSEQIDRNGRLSLYGIYFDFNKSTIRPQSHPTLKALSDMLKQREGFVLQIQGHTDNVGDPQYNMELSKKRAAAVMHYLIDNLGVGTNRLHAVGFGENKPVVSNDSEQQRTLNRRVDVVKLR